MSTKKFLYTLLVVYVVAAVVGVALFRSPGLSSAYQKEFGKEHKEFLKIKKSDWFKAYEERPKLHPPINDEQREAIEFAEHYEANPRFQAEEARAFWYMVYFRVLNSGVFVTLIGFALRKPLTGFLDGKIAEIRADLDGAAKAREEAAQLKASAREKIDKWETVHANIQKQADATLETELAKVRDEFEQARAQLEKELADRRQAEQYRAERTLKTELVEQAVATIENRYRTEATLERLTQNVDTFAKLMERMS